MPSATNTAAKLATSLLLTLPLIAGPAHSTVSLHSSRNPSTFGHTVTLTAAVRPIAASGTVTFYDGTTVLETEPLVNGEAQFTTTLLPADGNALKAYYSGDGTYAPSTSAVLMQTVNAIPGGALQPALANPAAEGYGVAPAVGDFNGDGKADVALLYSNSLVVLLGNGDGTFQPAVNYPVPVPSDSSPASITIGDFNGDGRTDLVVGTDGNDDVNLFLGNGDGTFQAPYIYPAWAFPTYMVVADFNGDGKADLGVINGEGGGVAVLLGNGNGSFQTPLPTDTSLYSASAAVGDFNGDGKPDLAITSSAPCCLPGPFLSVLLGNGDGTFQPPQTYSGFYVASSIVTADFNGDRRADLAVISGSNNLILLGNGDGTFQTPLSFPGADYGLAVADFNGDGKPDLVELDGNGYVSVMLGNGDGTFQTPATYYPSPFPSYSVAAADFNGDGRVDVAVTGYEVGISLATPAGETATGLTSNQNPSSYGQPVTLTATVSPLQATGTISFYSGFAGLGKIGLTNGQATITISTLNGGSDSLTAEYSGDATHPKSESAALIQTVNRASTFVGLTSAPDPSTVGQTVIFKATVSSTTATGTVTFYDGSTNLGGGTVANGVATLQVFTLSAGNHTITAVYMGDSNYEPSTSPNRIQKVN